MPYCPHPLVARHAWHRTNSNRPDNYEAIYEWHVDGKKRASRIFPYAVVAVGLTGCVQATGHPTQKHEALMKTIVARTDGTVLDPFMGSGSTGVACVSLGRKFVGVEIEPKYFDMCCERIEAAHAQGRLFA
jgi:DNA modification methylase